MWSWGHHSSDYPRHNRIEVVSLLSRKEWFGHVDDEPDISSQTSQIRLSTAFWMLLSRPDIPC